ncbi:MAG: hypothetical protein LBB22_00660 [Treponema sp.]|jgi:hypothetical protein|nr:hypothetical protein [Treponema sp.]
MSERRVRKIFFFIIIFTVMIFPLAAQYVDEIDVIEDDGSYEEIEDEEEDGNAGLPIVSDWDGISLSGYTRGDQIFNISLGIMLPLFFTSSNSGGLINNNFSIGGIGSLSYSYFLNSHLFLGGSLYGSFFQTLGKNFLYLIPVGFTVGYQFVLNRFEFPLSITIGGMTQQYLTFNGYWPFLKPQASGFFRFNSDWSFGLNVSWLFAPQWSNIPEKDAVGNFLEITLSARYHF